LKTVAEVARELGVSTQTIYRRLNSVEQGLTLKKGKMTYITDDGVAYLKEECSTLLNTVEHEKKSDSNEVKFLREQIRVLQEDIRVKDERYAELAERLAKIMENQQKLIGMEKMPLIEDKKKGLFGFMKKKNIKD